MREIGAGEIGVRGKVDETEIDDELQDLEHSDVLLPPDANTSGRLEVVPGSNQYGCEGGLEEVGAIPVHDNVNGQVESDWDPGDGSVADKLSVAKQGSGAMVIGM